jgi:hypothetical protein
MPRAVLSEVMQRFVSQRPVAVMVRSVLEKQFSDQFFETTFEEIAQEQYTHELAFSTCARLVSQVTLGQAQSVHAAFVKERETIPVSVASLYEKLQHVEPRVCEGLVQRSAVALNEVIMRLDRRAEPIPKYRLRILDGNVLASSEQRLKELRGTATAALPGRTLALYEYATGLLSVLVACEDGQTSERRLVTPLLDHLTKGDLLMTDRNFCTAVFLQELQERTVGFLIRHHAGLSLTFLGKTRSRGRCKTGKVSEQPVRLKCGLACRAIIIQRDKPLKDGGRRVTLLTNMPSRDASARRLADLYLQRWTIEEAFRQLTEYLACEVRTLGYPKAALFAFSLAVLAYNTLRCVQAALNAAHPDQKNQWSAFYLASEVKTTFEGLLVAVPAEEWKPVADMTNAELAAFLKGVAENAKPERYSKHQRGPKKTMPRKKVKSRHVSTAKLLQQRKATQQKAKAASP